MHIPLLMEKKRDGGSLSKPEIHEAIKNSFGSLAQTFSPLPAPLRGCDDFWVRMVSCRGLTIKICQE